MSTRPEQDGEVFFLSIPFHPLCYSNVTPSMLIAEVAPWTAAWAIQRIGGRARAKAARRAVLAAARPAPRATVRAVARPAVRTALQASARETARATASSDAPAHGRR